MFLGVCICPVILSIYREEGVVIGIVPECNAYIMR